MYLQPSLCKTKKVKMNLVVIRFFAASVIVVLIQCMVTRRNISSVVVFSFQLQDPVQVRVHSFHQHTFLIKRRNNKLQHQQRSKFFNNRRISFLYSQDEQQQQQQKQPECNENKNDNDTVRIEQMMKSTTTATNESRYNNYYTVTVVYDNMNCTINVHTNETILSALERQSNMLFSSLDILEMPSECRRGNCMTCAASISLPTPLPTILNQQQEASAVTTSMIKSIETTTQQSNEYRNLYIKQSDDENDNNGLSPYISDRLQQQNYILTCCTKVIQDGIIIELQQNTKVWDDIYQSRFTNDYKTQQAALDCMARVIRKSDEQNMQQYTRKIESIYDNSP